MPKANPTPDIQAIDAFVALGRQVVPEDASKEDAVAPLDQWLTTYGAKALHTVLFCQRLGDPASTPQTRRDWVFKNDHRNRWLADRVQKIQGSTHISIKTILKNTPLLPRSDLVLQIYLDNTQRAYDFVEQDARAALNAAAKDPLAFASLDPEKQKWVDQNQAWAQQERLLRATEAYVEAFAEKERHTNDPALAPQRVASFLAPLFQVQSPGASGLKMLFLPPLSDDASVRVRLLDLIGALLTVQFESQTHKTKGLVLDPQHALYMRQRFHEHVGSPWIGKWVEHMRQEKKSQSELVTKCEGDVLFFAAQSLSKKHIDWTEFVEKASPIDFDCLHQINWQNTTLPSFWNANGVSEHSGRRLTYWASLVAFFGKKLAHRTPDEQDQWLPTLEQIERARTGEVDLDVESALLQINHTSRPDADDFEEHMARRAQENIFNAILINACHPLSPWGEKKKTVVELEEYCNQIVSQPWTRHFLERDRMNGFSQELIVLPRVFAVGPQVPPPVHEQEKFFDDQFFSLMNRLPPKMQNTTRVLAAMLYPDMEQKLLADPFDPSHTLPVVFDDFPSPIPAAKNAHAAYQQKIDHLVLSAATKKRMDVAPSAPRSKM